MIDHDAPYRTVTEAGQVTDEIVDIVMDVVEGWYPEGRVDWQDVWDRVDGSELKDGSLLDMGNELDTPAIRRIKAKVRKLRSE